MNRMMKIIAAAIALAVVFPFTAGAAALRATYSVPTYTMGARNWSDASQSTVVPTAPTLFVPGMTIEEFISRGYNNCMYASMCGSNLNDKPTLVQSRQWQTADTDNDGHVDTALCLITFYDSGKNRYTKSVPVEFTDGEGGIHVRRMQGRYVKANSVDNKFYTLNADGTYSVTDSADGFDANVCSYTSGGYSCCGFEAARYVATGSPVLFWKNAAGEPDLTLDDIKDYDLTARFNGGSVNAKGTVVKGYNKRFTYDGNGSVTSIVAQFQLDDGQHIKYVAVEFTNGDGGVYAKSVFAGYGPVSQGYSLGYDFYQNGSWYTAGNGGTSSTVTTTPWNNNYGVYELTAMAPEYCWTGAANDGNLLTPGNWEVGGEAATAAPSATTPLVFTNDAPLAVTLAANASVPSIAFGGTAAVTITGTATLSVGRIDNASAATPVIAVPVVFLDKSDMTATGTYFVTAETDPVSFTGGVTATYPDVAMASQGLAAHTFLGGDFTFTADTLVITAPIQPFTVADGARLFGNVLTGTSSGTRGLDILEGGYAHFSCVTGGTARLLVSIDGTLESDGDIVWNTGASDFGVSGNVGTVKAKGFHKIGNQALYSYIPTYYIGADGFGCIVRDFAVRFKTNTTIIATADFDFKGVYNSGAPQDWGLYFDTAGVSLTIDTAGHTVTCGIGVNGSANGRIVKTGEGTLVMTNTDGETTGFTKTYGEGTVVNQGTLQIDAANSVGSGTIVVTADGALEVADGVTVSNNIIRDWPAGAPDGSAAFVWTGAANDGGKWATPGNWAVGGAPSGAAPAAGDVVVFDNAAAVTVDLGDTAVAAGEVWFLGEGVVTITGTATLTADRFYNHSATIPVILAPVAFTGAYYVIGAYEPVNFIGGATATVPHADLTYAGTASHTLLGNVTFTEDWTIPLQVENYPFIVGTNSTLRGGVLSAATYDNKRHDLRIDEGAVATFDSVAVAGKLVFRLNGGRLVSVGDITVGGDGNGRDFGTYNYANTGTVEANGVYKNVTGYGTIYIYTPDFVIGAGGFGMYRKDYSFQLQVDTTLTAKDDFTIYMPIAGDGTKENDWGINLDSHQLTVDTAGHTVTLDSALHANAGVLVKNGEGELVMQGRLKQHTGGTIVNGGTMTARFNNGAGYGTTTVNDGGTLALSAEVGAWGYPIVVNAGGTLANAAAVADSSDLTLAAGAILKPEQNTYVTVNGTLTLPEEGTVTVDMTGFGFVNGLSTPFLANAALTAGDSAKFAVLLPAGIEGAVTVENGIASFRCTAGGDAAASLYWNPQGDETWSTEVAAWTNSVGDRVAFTDYANATILDAGTVTLPDSVLANDVTVAADGDVTLTGAGGIGGSGTVTKSGEGTLTYNLTGGLAAQPIVVSNGVFRLGEDLAAGALGSSADTAPITIEDGGALEINYNDTTDQYAYSRSAVTHDKLIRIAGDGPDGNGAIVNNGANGAYRALGDVELTEDASIGGTKRLDFRSGAAADGYLRATTSPTLTGIDKKLTVKNTDMLALIGATVNVGSIHVDEGAQLRLESGGDWTSLTGGVHLATGTLSFYGFGTMPDNVDVVADSGSNIIRSDNATPTLSGPVTVNPGATLTHNGGTINYNGAVTGDITVSGGTANFNGGVSGKITQTGGVLGQMTSVTELDITGGTAYLKEGVSKTGLRVNGSASAAPSAGTVYLRDPGTYSGAIINAYNFCPSLNTGAASYTFVDSTLNVANFFTSWEALQTSDVTLGAGTVLNTGKIAIGDKGTGDGTLYHANLTIDGATVHHTGTSFFISYDGPNSQFILNSGNVTVDKASISLRNHNSALGVHNASRFVQNGGAFTYGGSGFTTGNACEDYTEDGFVVFGGGTFNATNNWSIPNYIPLCFKDGGSGWTLNQAEDTTVTWKTALHGDGDVTLAGAGASLVGDSEVQGAVGGHWTVGAGFDAQLTGAASMLGGLSVGEGASVTVNIATNRSAVFTARDGGDNPGKAGCITNRFNKVLGGTTRPTITHDETFLFTNYAQASRPFGNIDYQAAIAVGEFYVEEEAAGTWDFTGVCDDYVQLVIDGELVLTSPAACQAATGSKELTAGWHSFRHVTMDNTGGFGNAQTVGYKFGDMASYANFSVKNLRMRPAADMAGGESTVRWSHFKGTADTANANTYKGDFDWDYASITNSLGILQWYGNSNTFMNDYVVNRYEGWFLVTEENAGKAWTFKTQYDDRCALWIDGVDSGLTGNSGDKDLTYTVTLSRGWHRFEIRTLDLTGNAGPWSGKGNAVSYQIADGLETRFSEETLLLSVCPDGYVQGDVTLASNASLTNNVAESAAAVFGRIAAADGATGATVGGAFRFEGGTLDFGTVSAATTDLRNVLAFENAPADYLANVGEIKVDFAAMPSSRRIIVGAAGGLTTEEAQARLAVSIDGDATTAFKVSVEDGQLLIRRKGFIMIVR